MGADASIYLVNKKFIEKELNDLHFMKCYRKDCNCEGCKYLVNGVVYPTMEYSFFARLAFYCNCFGDWDFKSLNYFQNKHFCSIYESGTKPSAWWVHRYWANIYKEYSGDNVDSLLIVTDKKEIEKFCKYILNLSKKVNNLKDVVFWVEPPSFEDKLSQWNDLGYYAISPRDLKEYFKYLIPFSREFLENPEEFKDDILIINFSY